MLELVVCMAAGVTLYIAWEWRQIKRNRDLRWQLERIRAAWNNPDDPIVQLNDPPDWFK